MTGRFNTFLKDLFSKKYIVAAEKGRPLMRVAVYRGTTVYDRDLCKDLNEAS